MGLERNTWIISIILGTGVAERLRGRGSGSSSNCRLDRVITDLLGLLKIFGFGVIRGIRCY